MGNASALDVDAASSDFAGASSTSKITEKDFFLSIKKKLTQASVEKSITTFKDLSACFQPPPAAKYEGHPINKFDAIFNEHVLRKLTNAQDIPMSQISDLKVATLQPQNDEAIQISATIDKQRLLLDFMPSRNQLELEATAISFAFRRNCQKFDFFYYSLAITDFKITGTAIITNDVVLPGQQQTMRCSFTLNEQGLTIWLGQAQVITTRISQGSKVLERFLPLVPSISQDLAKLLQGAEQEAVFGYHTTMIKYIEGSKCWAPTYPTRFNFKEGAMPILHAVFKGDEEARLILKSISFQYGTGLQLLCKNQNEEIQSREYDTYDTNIQLDQYQCRIHTQSPAYQQVSTFVSASRRNNQVPSKRVRTLKNLGQVFISSVYNSIGDKKLQVDGNSGCDISNTLEKLPMLLQKCAAVFSNVQYFYTGNHSTSHDSNCTIVYSPLLVPRAEYDFFSIRAALYIRKTVGLSFNVSFDISLAEKENMPLPVFAISSVVDFNENTVWCAGQNIPEISLLRFIHFCKFLLPLVSFGAEEEVMKNETIKLVELHVRPYDEVMEFKLANNKEAKKSTLLLDLKSGYASLQLHHSNSNLIKFSIKRANHTSLLTRLWTLKALVDVRIEVR